MLSIAIVALSATSGTDAGLPAEKSLLEHYFGIQAALAGDQLAGCDEAARKLAADTKQMAPVAGQPELWTKAERAASKLAADKSLEAARRDFAVLSEALSAWVVTVHHGSVFVVNCPMAQASWLQRDNQVRNPYYGPSMSKCGTVTYAPATASAR